MVEPIVSEKIVEMFETVVSTMKHAFVATSAAASHSLSDAKETSHRLCAHARNAVQNIHEAE